MSVISETIRILTDRHSLNQVTDFPKVRGGCRLASGVETTFMALFCSHIMRVLDWPPALFHEHFYIPSRPAEGRVGYDLSIGNYTTENRVRTMHKVLSNGIWCDQPWAWSISATFDANRTPQGDYRHLRTLLRAFDEFNQLPPYLVLNVCYCIHDYRRMGTTYEDWQIPPFTSLLRTVILPIYRIAEQVRDWQEVLHDPNFNLTITKQAPQKREKEPTNDFLQRIAARDLFEVRVEPADIVLKDAILSFNDFCIELDNNIHREM